MPCLVDCYYCGCPVAFDQSGKLEEIGITIETCEKHNLAVICNLCLGMAELEDNVLVEVVDRHQLKEKLDKEVA